MIFQLVIIVIIICILDISKMKSNKSVFKDYFIFFFLIIITSTLGVIYSLNPTSINITKTILDIFNLNN